MGRAMFLDSEVKWTFFIRRFQNQIYGKLFVLFLLFGASLRFFLSGSFRFLGNPETPQVIDLDRTVTSLDPKGSMEEMVAIQNSISGSVLADEAPAVMTKQCDLFSGEWIPYPSGPAYTNVTCKFIEAPQNCLKNGRPDTGYLYWKWKPFGCDLPRFDAMRYLRAMQNKHWAFIGDSILRNHVQSMICLLTEVEEPLEVYHDKAYKSRRWNFTSHNFTLSLIWSPFLAKSITFEDDDGVSTSEIQLHLDALDPKWTSQYRNFDYILISGGQWFLKAALYLQNGTIIGCHYCPGKNLTEIALEDAYSKVLRLILDFFDVSSHKPLVIYRTWAPDHFENGEWFSGGTCNRTKPYRAGEFKGRDIDHVMLDVELEVIGPAAGSWGQGARVRLLDAYRLSLLRPDGHPGPYRVFHPPEQGRDLRIQNDCLHWCLPGPIDSWNDLLMELVSSSS